MKVIKINNLDNVVVALTDLKSGEVIEVDNRKIVLCDDIKSGHKIAISDIGASQNIIKYGLPIGHATSDISVGAWVHTHNVATNLSENTEFKYEPSFNELKANDTRTFFGYKRYDGRVGIRNEIWIVPIVGCVNSIVRNIERESQGLIEGNVDGIYTFTHPYGCSQIGCDLDNTKKLLSRIVHHPNAAGVLIVALGCENLTLDLFKEELGAIDENFIKIMVCQNEVDEVSVGKKLIKELVDNIKNNERVEVPISELVVGMKCGGSDGLSGITANPLVGNFSDKLIAYGGSTILTEVPEMFGAESILFNKCADENVFKKACAMVDDFKNYFTSHGQVVYENPSPGNKEGGITTLEDKSCGCVQKGGSAKVVDVLSYAEAIKVKGLNMMTGPGNDLVSSTNLMAAGAHIILFTTGRGTPFGTLVPTIKISTNNNLYNKKNNWIDFNAGILVEDNKETNEKIVSMDELGDKLLDYVIEVASGTKTKQEKIGAREVAIFKDGVTL